MSNTSQNCSNTDKVELDSVCLDKILHYFLSLNHSVMPEEYTVAVSKHSVQNWENAMHAAVRYFRERPVNPLFSDILQREYNQNTAERAAKGNVTVVNIPYQFPDGKIDFLFDVTKENCEYYNPEWQWQLNRMYFWNDMALAYQHTHDESIAAAFAQQVHQWVATVHCPAQWNGVGSGWRTIETGLRLMGSWQIAFEVFRKSPSVPDETLALMLASMHEQAHHALNHCTSHNWLLMELNGVHTFAAVFPEFTTSPILRQKSAELLSDEIRKQLLPDGMQFELSPDYHSIVIHCGAMLYRIAKINGFLGDLPEELGKNLEQSAEIYLQMMTPAFT